MKNKWDSGAWGGLVGAIVGVGGTIWGGYELGSLINDRLGVSNTFARGTLDAGIMGIIYLVIPIHRCASYSGMVIGSRLGTATHYVIEGARNLSDLILEKRDKNSNKND